VRVEYDAQFASAPNAYLRPDKIAEMFGPYNGAHLMQQAMGKLKHHYVAHADPSRSGANFAFAVAHLEEDEGGSPHVIFDVLNVWRPSDFRDGIVDYMLVEDEIFEFVRAFRIKELTFDQYSSVQSIQQLSHRALLVGFSWHPSIRELTATAYHNLQVAEIFKTALHLGLVHAPSHDLAQAELEYLVFDGRRVTVPTSGPVVTKDLADAMMNAAFTLLHDRTDQLHRSMAKVKLGASVPGGISARAGDTRTDPRDQLSRFGAGRSARRGGNPARGRHWRT